MEYNPIVCTSLPGHCFHFTLSIYFFRYYLPPTTIYDECSIVPNESHTMITFVRAIINTGCMFPEHIEAIKFKDRSQRIGSFFSIIRVGELSTTRYYTFGNICI